MRPKLDERKSQSSESDEEDNKRHDRFRSERFQERNRPTNTSDSRRRQERQNHDSERYTSQRHRDRSPIERSNRRDYTSSYSYKTERKSNYDRRGTHNKHSSNHKSSKKDRSERENDINTGSEKKSKLSHDCERPKINTNKLSSILQKFDKKVESKRSNVETNLEIVPAVPHSFGAGNTKEKSISRELVAEEASIGPALPQNLKNIAIKTDSETVECDSDVEKDTFDVALPPSCSGKLLSSEHNVKSKKEDSVSLSGLEKKSGGNMEFVESPALPPQINIRSKANLKEDFCKPVGKHASNSTNCENTFKDDENLKSVGVSLPKTESDLYRPALPPKVETCSYGPALPPNFMKSIVKGPTLPSGLTADDLESMAQDESDDEDLVGPLPEGKMNLTQYQLDLRAAQIKKKLEDEKSETSQDIKKREEWMLELPPEKASNLGLGPRSFRMREAPDMSNRSSWTDTPADKLEKAEKALRGETEPVSSEETKRVAFLQERDKVLDKMSEQCEDRTESLLEAHQKKLKKKKKKEEKDGKKKERRPFDRNIDLQVNRFDEAQKKSIFKKAQLLNTRFSTGESKYL